MIIGLFEQEIIAYAVFGMTLNLLFSMIFGLYLSKNIGLEEMMMSKGSKKQPFWMLFMLIIPFAKMGLTLYRIAILQFYFLNQGYTHKEYWVYLTND